MLVTRREVMIKGATIAAGCVDVDVAHRDRCEVAGVGMTRKVYEVQEPAPSLLHDRQLDERVRARTGRPADNKRFMAAVESLLGGRLQPRSIGRKRRRR